MDNKRLDNIIQVNELFMTIVGGCVWDPWQMKNMCVSEWTHGPNIEHSVK